MPQKMYKGIPFSPQAALADNISESAAVIPVTDISAFPDAPNLATIGTDEGGETILCRQDGHCPLRLHPGSGGDGKGLAGWGDYCPEFYLYGPGGAAGKYQRT